MEAALSGRTRCLVSLFSFPVSLIPFRFLSLCFSISLSLSPPLPLSILFTLLPIPPRPFPRIVPLSSISL